MREKKLLIVNEKYLMMKHIIKILLLIKTVLCFLID